MPDRAYRVGGIYDPVTADVSGPATILVENGRFAAVDGDAPRGLAVEDFSHAIAMPGLVDAHTHLSIATPGDERAQVARPAEERVLRALVYAEAMLSEGVTTIRLLGEPTGSTSTSATRSPPGSSAARASSARAASSRRGTRW